MELPKKKLSFATCTRNSPRSSPRKVSTTFNLYKKGLRYEKSTNLPIKKASTALLSRESSGSRTSSKTDPSDVIVPSASPSRKSARTLLKKSTASSPITKKLVHVQHLSKEESRSDLTREKRAQCATKEASVLNLPSEKTLVQSSKDESRTGSPTRRKPGKSPSRGLATVALPTAKSSRCLSRESSCKSSPNKVSIATKPLKRPRRKLSTDALPPKRLKARTVVEKKTKKETKRIRPSNLSKGSANNRRSSISPTLVKQTIISVFNQTQQKDLSNDDSPMPPLLKSKTKEVKLTSPNKLSRGSGNSKSPTLVKQTIISVFNQTPQKDLFDDSPLHSPLKSTFSSTKRTVAEKEPPNKLSNVSAMKRSCSKSPTLVKRTIISVFNQTPQKDLSDDDSPLPSPLKSMFSSTNKRLSFGSPKNRSPRRSPKKNSGYYHNALDRVLNELQDDIEEDLKLQRLEEKLQHVISDSHQLLDEHENSNSASKFSEPSGDRTQEPPPGLKILEPALCFRHFSNVEDILDLDKLVTSAMPTPHEIKLSQLSASILPEFVVKGGFMQSTSENVNPSPNILIFLLRLMAIHADKDVVMACQNAFKHYESTCDKDFRWCPVQNDIASIFLNFGILVSGIREHCPVKEFLLAVKEEISRQPSRCKKAGRLRPKEPTLHECFCKRKHSKNITDYYNFRAVLETLAFCILRWNTYSSSHLSDLILLLCWLALDKLLLLEDICFAVKSCIANSLSAIAEEEWLNKLTYLTEALIQLGRHHHNTLYILQLLPPCSRGIQLQRSTAFAAIQSLMGVEPIVDTVVTPKKILRFLNEHSLDKEEDYYLLYNIFSMLDISVGNDFTGHEAVLQALGNLLMRTFSIINDSLLCIERTQLKNLLITIRSKWIFITQTLPAVKMNPIVEEEWQDEIKKTEMPRSATKLDRSTPNVFETRNENIAKNHQRSPVQRGKRTTKKLTDVFGKNRVQRKDLFVKLLHSSVLI